MYHKLLTFINSTFYTHTYTHTVYLCDFCGSVNKQRIFLISDFRRVVDEICALLGYYAAQSTNSLATFRENLSVPSYFLSLEFWTDRFCRNVDKELPLCAA